MSMFRRRLLMMNVSSNPIPPVDNYFHFEDPEVESVFVNKYSSDGIGITLEEYLAINNNNINAITFQENNKITTFNEFGLLNITFVPANFFMNCTNLKSVRLPHLVDDIKDSAFNNCTSLTDIDLLKYEKQIKIWRRECFKNCPFVIENLQPTNRTYWAESPLQGTGVKSLTNLGSHFTELHHEYFGMTELRILELPPETKKNGWAGLYNVPKLEKIYLPAITPPEWNGGIVVPSTCNIYVPDESIDAYKTASGWSKLKTQFRPISEYIKEYEDRN